MNSKSKRLIRAAAVGAAVLSTLALSTPAFAASKCAGPGYLCVFDYEAKDPTKAYGNFGGNNPNWGVYGWDARADWFSNQGVSKNVCVLQLHNYTGSRYTILRGKRWAYPNYGRSNLWTSATKC